MAVGECWNAGLIPSVAPWFKELALLQLQPRLQLHLGSDPWPGSSVYHGATKKKNQLEEGCPQQWQQHVQKPELQGLRQSLASGEPWVVIC